MKGILNKFFIVIILILNNACSVQHDYVDYKYERNIQKIVPEKQEYNYRIPTVETQIKQPNNTLENSNLLENQMYQNPNLGTSSTGPR